MDSSGVVDPETGLIIVQSCLTRNHDLDLQRSSNRICIQILESGRSKAPGARRSVECFFIRTMYFFNASACQCTFSHWQSSICSSASSVKCVHVFKYTCISLSRIS